MRFSAWRRSGPGARQQRALGPGELVEVVEDRARLHELLAVVGDQRGHAAQRVVFADAVEVLARPTSCACSNGMLQQLHGDGDTAHERRIEHSDQQHPAVSRSLVSVAVEQIIDDRRGDQRRRRPGTRRRILRRRARRWVSSCTRSIGSCAMCASIQAAGLPGPRPCDSRSTLTAS